MKRIALAIVLSVNMCICADELFVGTSIGVQRYSTDGTFLGSIAESTNVSQVAADDTGHLFYSGHRPKTNGVGNEWGIWKYNLETGIENKFATNYHVLYGLEIDSYGHVFANGFVDLWEYTPTGEPDNSTRLIMTDRGLSLDQDPISGEVLVGDWKEGNVRVRYASDLARGLESSSTPIDLADDLRSGKRIIIDKFGVLHNDTKLNGATAIVSTSIDAPPYLLNGLHIAPDFDRDRNLFYLDVFRGIVKVTPEGRETVVGHLKSPATDLVVRTDSSFDALAAVADLSGDGAVDVIDAEVVSRRLYSRQVILDANQDGIRDENDVVIFAKRFANVQIGDVTRDGRFDSSDLVRLFQTGAYEDSVFQNSSWLGGDWTGDREFDSSDLVFAFSHGSYEGTVTNVVPEPNLNWMSFILILVMSRFVFVKGNE